MMQRVLVCGGRDFTNASHLEFLLDETHRQNRITCIIHGGAKGADALAGEWADKNEISTEVYPADWDTHGKSAGPIRNLEMLAKSKPDVVIAFPGGKGTAHMRKVARAHGVPVVIIRGIP